MGCTKCDIAGIIRKTALRNKVKFINSKLLSRIIYERINQNNKQVLTFQTKRITEKIQQNSIIPTLSKNSNAVLLAQYKYYIAEQLKLKLQTFKNMDEYEKIREQLYQIDDKLWSIKNELKRNINNEEELEEKLLKIRIDTKKEVLDVNCSGGKKPEKIKTMENNNTKLKINKEISNNNGLLNSMLSSLNETEAKERLKIAIQNEYPELEPDIINDLVD